MDNDLKNTFYSRPLSKLADVRQVQEVHGAQETAIYENVHEDLSTKSTTQLPLEVEFPKRFIAQVMQDVTIGTSGRPRVIVSLDGKVGINVSSPVNDLVVKNAANVPTRFQIASALTGDGPIDGLVIGHSNTTGEALRDITSNRIIANQPTIESVIMKTIEHYKN